jgi:hypothetical protein
VSKIAALWIESDEYDLSEATRPCDGFLNVVVRLTDGSAYAMNVWSAEYAATVALDPDGYELGPDLIVRSLSRNQLMSVFERMIECEELPAHCKIA